MSEIILEVARQLPSAVAIIGLVYLFLRYDAEREKRREINAKEMSTERRAWNQQENTMWANYIKALIDKQNEFHKMIADALTAHERESQRRYEKMGVTRDLVDAVKHKTAPLRSE